MRRTSPSVQRLGSAVLVQGAALAELLHLVTLGARERSRRDAIAPSARLADLIATLAEAVAEGSSRHHDTTDPTSSKDWTQVDEIGSAEAAELLGLSLRQTQRLGASIGARASGRGFVYDKAAVIAYAAHRREQGT